MSSARLHHLAPLAASLCGCITPASAPRHLDPALLWVDGNRERLDAMLDQYAGADSKPVAIFDWDNTVIKNDVGDIMTFWMLRNDKVLQPADWSATSRYLTPEAVKALDAACGGLATPGQPLPTSLPEHAACADELLAVYYDGATTAGADAFANWNYRTMEPSYAWAAQLQAGYTPAEITAFASAAIDAALAAEIGAEQTVGTTTVNAYLRVYEPIADLIGALQADGFDVWVLSASPQPVVEAFAAHVDVPADHVVGIRAVVDDAGQLTADLQGCGAVADGEDSQITYLEGKRCWMNKVIFGVEGPAAAEVQTDDARRPVFAAGDSDTDVAFLQDAIGLRLAINRNKKELMCNAYHDFGGNWLVNPMFIAPKERLEGGYACSVDACKDSTGAGVPCKDERGEPIPDQQDTSFCAAGVYCQR